MGYIMPRPTLVTSGGSGGGGLPGRFMYASAAGAVNNVAPVGFPGTQGARLVATFAAGNANWTGLKAGGFDGQQVLLINDDAANSVTLNNDNAGSLAANRFFGPGGNDVIVPAGDSIWLTYDNTLANWIVTP